MFECPGCKTSHGIRVGHQISGGNVWGWNGDMVKPTFSPSILVCTTAFTEKGEQEYKAWAEAGYPNGRGPFESKPVICHSFVREGRIQFLHDCTHGLAGLTVDLPILK